MNYLDRIKKEKIPREIAKTLEQWYHSYLSASQIDKGHAEAILNQYLDLVLQELQQTTPFDLFHKSMRSPIDYYRLGIDFIRPLVITSSSTVQNLPIADQITHQLNAKENAILLANHQTELDPQAISLLLEKTHPKLAEEMIFVAGHRVTTDPMATPFSKGRNLLCIYSKKHIADDPNLKEKRQQHNQRTMSRMAELLSEGGQCIYVAPSGGRDRADAHGKIKLDPFDPQSIEMFWLMAQKAQKKTHFYPLALDTYELLPPPGKVEKQLGESRHTKATAIHLAFGTEIDMEHFPGCDTTDKKEKRQRRAHFIWEQVNQMYHAFP